MNRRCFLAVLCVTSCAAQHFQLGACYDDTNWFSFLNYVAKIALERDFFNDILNVTNFTVSVASVDSGCSATQAAQVSLPLILGKGTVPGRIYSAVDVPPVIAISGCVCSDASASVSRQSVSFKIPMVSGTSSSPDLSNKLLYSYFARTFPTSVALGKGLGKLVVSFNWKRVYGIHILGSDISTGQVNAFCKDTRDRGCTCEIRSFPFVFMRTANLPTLEDNWPSIRKAAEDLSNELPAARILFIAASPSTMWLPYALYHAGLATDKHFWIVGGGVACNMRFLSPTGSESLARRVSGFKKISNNSIWNDSFWLNMPERLVGLGCLVPKAHGPRLTSPAFENFWASLTRSTIIQAGFPPSLWEQRFLDRSTLVAPYWVTHFDAMTSIIVAISRMLSKGMAPSSIKGEVLRNTILNISFEGLSGLVSFDGNGDRQLPYIVSNLQMSRNTSRTTLIGQSHAGKYHIQPVGVYDSASDSLTLHEPFIFRDGTTTAPLDRPAPCLQGFEWSGGGKACIPCKPGKYGIQQPSDTAAQQAISGCISCPTGTFSNTSAATECTFCQPGRSRNTSGGSLCGHCLPGTYAATLGATTCDDCTAGFYQHESTSTGCSRCIAGSYAVGLANVACNDCPSGLVTEYPGAMASSDCKCPTGTYAAHRLAITCKSCPKGMTCPLGSTEDSFKSNNGSSTRPTLQRGYWSSITNPMVTFACVDDSENSPCKGGLPPGCDGGRTGIVCSQCPSGRTKAGDKCKQCAWWDIFVAISFFLAILVTPIWLFHWLRPDHKWRLTAKPALFMTLEILVELGQAAGCLGSMRINWPPVALFVLEFFAGVPFKVSVYDPVGSFPCVVPSWLRSDFLDYLGMAVLIPGIAAYLWAIYPFCSRLLPPRIRWDYHATVHTVFRFLNIVFIGQVFISMLPFQCYSHPSPNPKTSIQHFPATFCYSGEHVGIGVVSLVLCIAFYAYMCWETCQFRKTFASCRDRQIMEGYITRITFLLEDFKMERYYWNVIMKVVEFAIGGIVIVLIPDSTRIQIFIYITIFVICGYVWIKCGPYKIPLLNLATAIYFGFLALLLLVVTTDLPAATDFDKQFTKVVLLVTIVSKFLLFFFLISVAVVTICSRGSDGELLALSLLDSTPSWAEIKRRWNVARSWRDDDLEKIVAHWQVHDLATFANILETFEVSPDASSVLTRRATLSIADTNYEEGLAIRKSIRENMCLKIADPSLSCSAMVSYPSEKAASTPTRNSFRQNMFMEIADPRLSASATVSNPNERAPSTPIFIAAASRPSLSFSAMASVSSEPTPSTPPFPAEHNQGITWGFAPNTSAEPSTPPEVKSTAFRQSVDEVRVEAEGHCHLGGVAAGYATAPPLQVDALQRGTQHGARKLIILV